MVNAGGQWSDSEVVVDGNLITSRKPDDLPAFMQAVIQAAREAKPALSAAARL
jgi:protease I